MLDPLKSFVVPGRGAVPQEFPALNVDIYVLTEAQLEPLEAYYGITPAQSLEDRRKDFAAFIGCPP